MYAQKGDNVFVNLFANSSASLNVLGKPVEITQENNYPWDGDLKFTISPKKSPLSFGLLVRIPGWARDTAIPSDLYYFEDNGSNKVVIKINGSPVEYTLQNGYAVIQRAWKKNDVVEVSLPMEVRRVVANKNAKDDAGKVALQRGPLMYCAEWADNNGRAANIVLPANTVFTTEYNPTLLNGITLLKSEAIAVVVDQDKVSTVRQPFVAIPYYAWANRGPGEMMLWFPEKIKDVDIVAQ